MRAIPEPPEEPDKRKDWPWPGNFLTHEDVHKLEVMRALTGDSVSRLIKKAISALHDVLVPKKDA